MARPDQLVAAATDLREQVGGLQVVMSAVIAKDTPLVWVGGAAKRFDTELQEHQTRLRRAADELASLSDRLAASAPVTASGVTVSGMRHRLA